MFFRYRQPFELARFFRTSVPVMLFQSDDWGNSTWPSVKELQSYEKQFGRTNLDGWASDAFERESDLARLADVLRRHHDVEGNTPVFGLNYIVGRPDYAAIREARFTAYQWGAVDYTDAAISVVRQGIQEGLFEAGLHGLEHFNPAIWLGLLSTGCQELTWFFDRGYVPPNTLLGRYRGLGAAWLNQLGGEFRADLALDQRLSSALKILRNWFGGTPFSATAPNHAWDDEAERLLTINGVGAMQAANFHYRSLESFDKGDPVIHPPGSRSPDGELVYFGRNVEFEPGRTDGDVGRSMREICRLLDRKIPAIINTHRVNFVASICPDGAESSLRDLDGLLGAVIERYPDVRFLGAGDLLQAVLGRPVLGHRSRGVSCLPRSRQIFDLLKDLAIVTVNRRGIH